MRFDDLTNELPKSYRPKLDYGDDLDTFIKALEAALVSNTLNQREHSTIVNWLDVFEEARSRYEFKKRLVEKKIERRREIYAKEQEALKTLSRIRPPQPTEPEDLHYN